MDIRAVSKKLVLILICCFLFDVCASDTVRILVVIYISYFCFFFPKFDEVNEISIFQCRYSTSRSMVTLVLQRIEDIKV